MQVHRLEEKVREGFEKNLFQTDFWQALENNAFEKSHYLAFLRETYHYTKSSALIQVSAVAHFQKENRHLVPYFLSHAKEEESHYLLCQNDIDKILGQKTPLSEPLPLTEGYLGYIFNQINYVDPLCYLGYLYQLEYMAVHIGPVFLEKLGKMKGAPLKGTSFLSTHALLDMEHLRELSSLIEKEIDESKSDTIIRTATVSSCLYAKMMDDAFRSASALFS